MAGKSGIAFGTPFAATAIVEHIVGNPEANAAPGTSVAAHRSDEDRWARAQHDMKGSSQGQRAHYINQLAGVMN